MEEHDTIRSGEEPTGTSHAIPPPPPSGADSFVAQLQGIFGNLLDEKLKPIAREEDVIKLRKSVDKMFAEVVEVKQKISRVEGEQRELSARVTILERKLERAEKRLVVVERAGTMVGDEPEAATSGDNVPPSD